MSDITNYVPVFLLQSKILQEIYNVENEELISTEDAIEDLLNQCFVDTATWGLDLWDEFLGINTREYSTEERRNILKNKLLMQPPFTLSRLYSLLNNVADNVYITEDYADYTFEITLLVKDKLKTALNKIIAQIEEVKPAHLDYKLILGYLLDLDINISFSRWLSEVLKQCGTIDTSGNEVITTQGRKYKENFIDSKQLWPSEKFLIASEITVMTATNGKTYNDMFKDSKQSWLSIVIPVANTTTYCGLEVYA